MAEQESHAVSQIWEYFATNVLKKHVPGRPNQGMPQNRG
jgi:hypothetical protein